MGRGDARATTIDVTKHNSVFPQLRHSKALPVDTNNAISIGSFFRNKCKALNAHILTSAEKKSVRMSAL